MKHYHVCILGGGPAGLAAAVSAAKEGVDVLIIERESKLGGILKQCIHDGFGIERYKARLTGPEYADHDIKEMLKYDNIDFMLNAFATEIGKQDDGTFYFIVQTPNGILNITSDTVVLACGCRERTSRQVSIQGDRPAGIFSAGTAQHYVNLMGYLPTKKCVILGSGDIGLIMARRLFLEGAEVEGVYEIMPAPAGLARNVSQCLDDFGIPLHLSATVTRVIGDKRVEAVEVCQVDQSLKPIEETKRIVECDALILSVGLIPENEMAEMLGVKIDPATKGAYVDQRFMTNVPGVFSCGNALHVNDLADYVSESGDLAGKYAALYKANVKHRRMRVSIDYSGTEFAYVVPQYYDIPSGGDLTFYFRPRRDKREQRVVVSVNGNPLRRKRYKRLLPSEMQTLTIQPEEKVECIHVRLEDA